jgi:hypothetical protein
LVNSCCYIDWFKSIDAYLKEEKPYCWIPDFRLYVQVSSKYHEFAPRYYAQCGYVEPEELQGIEAIDSYVFWLRAYYCRLTLHRCLPSPLFDIYYPKKKRNWQNIEVIVQDFKSNTKRIYKWRHGRHGLFRVIADSQMLSVLSPQQQI